MPRQARLDAPGALHHVMIRGVNRSPIFSDDHDRSDFLDRLARNLEKDGTEVYAWALMKNHVHLLLKSGSRGLSSVMRCLLTGYARAFNRRHGRRGHLFENRYKSILCDGETYLLTLVRYIHLNPYRVRVVSGLDELDRHPWAGHSALMGHVRRPWMDTHHVLSQFSPVAGRAQRAYRRFVEEGVDRRRRPEFAGGGLVRSLGGWSAVRAIHRRGERPASDERILGGGEFVERVLREAEERHVRQLGHRRAGSTLERIVDEECRRCAVSVQELSGGSRRALVSRVRATVAYRGREELGLGAAEMARRLGVNTSSIVRAIGRAEGWSRKAT
ncbi:MAG: transposase [Nitrospirae bacterium]|nr:transposase [Nitrospirota bacterium]